MKTKLKTSIARVLIAAAIGCVVAAGFHFSRPVIAADKPEAGSTTASAADEKGDEKADDNKATTKPSDEKAADKSAENAGDKSAEKPADKTAADDKPEAEPVASVKTIAARVGDISQSIVAYGTVTAQPGEVAVSSVPFEARVKHIPVTGGQPVDKGTTLIEVEPSPEARLQLLEARNAVESSKKDLEQVQQRFNMKLATNSDLLLSQQATDVAKFRLDSLEQRGAADDSRKITAEFAGLVSKVDVQEGQLVAAGGPLLETLARDRIVVRLGVEPADISRIQIDQPVHIFVSSGGDVADESIAAKVRLITQRLNPDTRLVDVFAAPESADKLILDSNVRAELTAETRQGLIVPRDAALPDDEGTLVYTVKDDKAVKHVVKMGVHNDKEVQIISDDIKAGDLVVVQGNLELEDGMKVAAKGTK